METVRHDYQMKSKIAAFKTLHFLLSAGLFYGAWLLFRYHEYPQVKDIGFRYNYFVLLGYCAMLAFFNRTYNSYLYGYMRVRTLALSMFMSHLFSVGIIYFGVSIGWNNFKNPIWFLVLLMVYTILDIQGALQGNRHYFKMNPPRKTLLIYRNTRDRRRFGSIKGKPTERLYKIVDEIEFDGTFDEIKEKLITENYDAVFVAGVNSHCRNGILKWCEENDKRGFFLPHIGDVIMQGAQHVQAFDTPVMMTRRKTLKPEYRVAKRTADIIFAVIGLVIASPVMIATAIAIKVYDGGPVFYKQVRLTRDGREFKIIKFRSMKVDAEKDGVARLSTGEKDDRITPVGRLVRACRIDELPQLINIFIGDMSFVGPRPERPEIAEQYYQIMPDFRLRLQVKAGLTGYAQVYGKYNTEPYEKLEFDLMYINSMSILTDLELIFATVGILLKKESTAGVAGTTAIDFEEDK